MKKYLRKRIVHKLLVTAVLFWCSCVLFACGPDLSSFDSLISHQPRVIAIKPADGLVVPSKTVVTATFSVPVDPTSIGPQSFAVVKLSGNWEKLDDLASDILSGQSLSVTGTYKLSDDWREASFESDSTLEEGETYAVIITTHVKTTIGLPLNQKPGEEPTPFWSRFSVMESENFSGNSSGDDGASGGDATGDNGGGQSPGNGGSELPEPQRPSVLVINEFLYDASGDETDGNLFVELVGNAKADIGGYKIIFINGADGSATETIEIPQGSIIPDDGIFLIADSRTSAPTQTHIPNADFLDNFDPQNGPDCVQLVDDHSALLDAVGYGTPLPQKAQSGLACYEGNTGPDAPAGKSISRTNAIDTNNNAADFSVIDIPTPGIL